MIIDKILDAAAGAGHIKLIHVGIIIINKVVQFGKNPAIDFGTLVDTNGLTIALPTVEVGIEGEE